MSYNTTGITKRGCAEKKSAIVAEILTAEKKRRQRQRRKRMAVYDIRKITRERRVR